MKVLDSRKNFLKSVTSDSRHWNHWKSMTGKKINKIKITSWQRSEARCIKAKIRQKKSLRRIKVVDVGAWCSHAVIIRYLNTLLSIIKWLLAFYYFTYNRSFLTIPMLHIILSIQYIIYNIYYIKERRYKLHTDNHHFRVIPHQLLGVYHQFYIFTTSAPSTYTFPSPSPFLRRSFCH